MHYTLTLKYYKMTKAKGKNSYRATPRAFS